MAKPQFVNMNGELTTEGQKLVTWLGENLKVMEAKNAAELNTYAGPLKYLFSNRHVGLTPERFVREMGSSYALNAYGIMEAVEKQEAQAVKVEETAQQTSTLATELETVKSQLAEALSAIKTLQEAKTEKPAKKPAKVEATEEVEDESESE